MKFVLPFFAFLFLGFVSFSQFESFDLSNYKLPDIKRHQLDFYLYSSGNTRNNFFSDEMGNNIVDNKHNYFTWNGNLNFHMFSSNQKFQKRLNANFSSDNNYSFDENNYSAQRESFNYSERLNFSLDWKNYLNDNEWFINLIPIEYFNYSRTNNLQREENNKSFRIYNTSSLGIGIGKGRIEQVQDFRHAVLLVDEFRKRGNLEKEPTETEILELATLISKLKNQRIFDSRKRKEIDLNKVDSLLTKLGLISQKSISYFVGLEDIWVFGGLQTRESGNQIKLIFTPEYYYENSGVLEEKFRNERSSYSVNGDLIFTSKKSRSTKIQNDWEIGLYNELSNNYKVFSDAEKYKSFVTDFRGNYSLGYYPNTRTYLNVSAKAGFGHTKLIKTRGDNFFRNWINISSQGYYYISERFRIGYLISYDNILYHIFDKELKNDKNSRMNYTMNLNYAIF